MSQDCDHSYDDQTNDDFVGDESEKNLLVTNNGSCTRCRKLSNSSSILSYDNKLRNWMEDINNVGDGDEFNGNAAIPSIMFPQTRLSVNSCDSGETPVMVRERERDFFFYIHKMYNDAS